MSVPAVLQNEPITYAWFGFIMAVVVVAVGVVLYFVRERDLERSARVADVKALSERIDGRIQAVEARLEVEVKNAKGAAYASRDELSAFRVEVAQNYVSHDQLVRALSDIRSAVDDVKTDVRALRELIVEALRNPPARPGGRARAG